MQWIVTIALLLGLHGAFADTAKQPTVKLVTTNWPPYTIKRGKDHGYVFDLVKASYEQAGFNVKVKFMSWQDALNAVKNGKADGIFPVYPQDKAHGLVLSQQFSGGPIVLYRRRDNAIPLTDARDPSGGKKLFWQLRNKRFGAVSGYQNVPAFDDNRGLSKRFVLDDKANLRQLYAGKVDFAVIDQFTAEAILQYQLPRAYRQSLVMVTPALGQQQLYLGFAAKGKKQLVAKFNQGLDAISKNGVLASILDKDAALTGQQIA